MNLPEQPRADLISVSEVPTIIQRIRGGRRISRCTAWRWATRGCRGRKLWAQWTGGGLETTEAAVRDFLERCERIERPKPKKRGPKGRKGAFEQAMRVLREVGSVASEPYSSGRRRGSFRRPCGGHGQRGGSARKSNRDAK